MRFETFRVHWDHTVGDECVVVVAGWRPNVVVGCIVFCVKVMAVGRVYMLCMI